MQIELKELNTDETHTHCEFSVKKHGSYIDPNPAFSVDNSDQPPCAHVAVVDLIIDDNPETGSMGRFCHHHGSLIGAGLLRG